MSKFIAVKILPRAILVLSSFVFATLVLCEHRAAADGALAIGLPPDIEDGFVWAYVINRKTRDEAYNTALGNCRSNKDASAEAIARCRVVATFRNKCVAIARDTDSTGVGWSVDEDIRVAEGDALTKCVATNSGEDDCEIKGRGCDRTR